MQFSDGYSRSITEKHTAVETLQGLAAEPCWPFNVWRAVSGAKTATEPEE